jgi:hypothetical protein
MPNPAINQLIAAGASPKRARAFTDMVANKAQPMSMPEVATPQIMGVGMPQIQSLGAPQVAGAQPQIGKPKGPGEWYSDDYAAASQSWASSNGLAGYNPPEFGTPEFQQYFDYTKGPGAYKKIETNLYAKYAPTYKAALTSTSPLDKAIIPYLPKGIAPQQIVDGLMKNPAAYGLTTRDQAESYVNKLFNEYTGVADKVDSYIGTIDKNYRYKLPDPKFKYGTTTNFKSGTVDVLNNYWANTKYKTFEQQLKGSGKYTPTQIAQALSNAKTQLVTAVAKSGVTPFKDEQARRDALKKGK